MVTMSIPTSSIGGPGSLYEIGIIAAQVFLKSTKAPADTDTDTEVAKP